MLQQDTVIQYLASDFCAAEPTDVLCGQEVNCCEKRRPSRAQRDNCPGENCSVGTMTAVAQYGTLGPLSFWWTSLWPETVRYQEEKESHRCVCCPRCGWAADTKAITWRTSRQADSVYWSAYNQSLLLTLNPGNPWPKPMVMKVHPVTLDRKKSDFPGSPLWSQETSWTL